MKSEDIKEYYDDNTRRFLKFGQHAETQAIHQPIWAPGIKTVAEAVNYSHHLILDEIKTLGNGLDILDLGCGVGASLKYMSEQLAEGFSFWGITISSEQAQIAKNQFLEKRIKVLEGNYLDIPKSIPKVDLAFCLEAFIHAEDGDRFFKSVSANLNPGGKLIIIDDFKSKENEDAKILRLISAYQNGWHAPNFETLTHFEKIAGKYSLTLQKNERLNDYLKIGRPRDRFIKMYTRLFDGIVKDSKYFKMLKGGAAKQDLIRNGMLDYNFVVFEKS